MSPAKPKASASLFADLDRRPAVVAITGPNGAGKSTYFEAHLKASGLRFINADVLAGDLGLAAYQAAEVTARLRKEFLTRRESFIFETVFSDPAGDKLAFLKQAAQNDYNVVLCFIGIADPDRSEERVAMRVSQGGHDVSGEKLIARFPRTMSNLKRAIQELPCVYVYDNDDLRTPFRLVAIYRNRREIYLSKSIPKWFQRLRSASSAP